MSRITGLLIVVGTMALALICRSEDRNTITVLFEDQVTKVDGARILDGVLWVPASALPDVNGFELKPMGLCSKSQCIPVPAGSGWLEQDGDDSLVAVSKIAEHLDQAVVADERRSVWVFSVVPSERESKLESGEAPDFALPDRMGNIVRLSDFRGKKVLLLTWASWCKCSLDLPRWQRVYEDLRDDNFEIVAVAQDTAGESAAGPHYDAANATYTTLIDQKHTVTALYQMVNVPSGVWIDEKGHVVRPPEVAYTKGFRLLGQKVGDDRYEPALRDWVVRGEESPFRMNGDQLKAKLSPELMPLRLADLEFRLGVYLFGQGDKVGARKHWEAAQKLDPNNWNYHRQDWSFDSKEAIRNWITKVRSLGDKPYYAPIEFETK